MKQLKDSLKKLNEKYVTVETLSQEEKERTYGGSSSKKQESSEDLLCYGTVTRPTDPDGPILS